MLPANKGIPAMFYVELLQGDSHFFLKATGLTSWGNSWSDSKQEAQLFPEQEAQKHMTDIAASYGGIVQYRKASETVIEATSPRASCDTILQSLERI